MVLLGSLIKRGLRLRKTINKVRKGRSAIQWQRETLVKLLKKAKSTQFGHAYDFDGILKLDSPMVGFQQSVPIFDYTRMHKDWWSKSLAGEHDVSWPGSIKYYALSSGTSGAASKYIPVTSSMIKSMRRTSIRQLLTLVNYDLPEDLFGKGVLVLGGSSDLEKVGNYFMGDLSGINQANMPFYSTPFYKPGKAIARQKDWNLKIDEIVKKAPSWDIGMITGVPAWNQIVLERIIQTYRLNTIHDIWPNLSVFIYGGVAFEPYRSAFDRLLGKPIHCLETYLASEGFLAYQSRKEVKGMELVLNNGIFMEFIPFNSLNFNEIGELRPEAQIPLLIDEVRENEEYAILISTNAGAWRYLIGDTIKFSSVIHREIIITGRTKHFLSLCGEHLSVDNMSRAVELLAEQRAASFLEFTVAPMPSGHFFGHHWYIGCSDSIPLDSESLASQLDSILCMLNDDYKVERQHALKEVQVTLLPVAWFYEWLEIRGKIGAQSKFPRVLRGELLKTWGEFILHKQRLG